MATQKKTIIEAIDALLAAGWTKDDVDDVIFAKNRCTKDSKINFIPMSPNKACKLTLSSL